MTKEIISLSNDQQTIYNAVFQKSFAAQRNDLRLRDCTDVFGSLKASYLLNQYVGNDFIVKEPYIFKLSKGEKSILVLGTNHILPIQVYPRNLINLMAERKCLLIEKIEGFNYGKNLDSGNSSERFNSQSLRANYDIDEISEWFTDLPEYYQNRISDLCGFLPKGTTAPNQILNYLQFITSNYFGMDSFLFNAFNSDFSRLILPLEDFSIATQTTQNLSKTDALRNLINMIEDDLQKGGCLAEPWSIIFKANYILGKDFQICSLLYSNESMFAARKEVIKRNHNWVEKIIEYFNKPMMSFGNELSDSILIAVGNEHCRGKEGVLGILHDDYEFNVERADLSGSFHDYEII